MSESEEAENDQLLTKVAHQLAEKFECVQIFVSWQESGLTEIRRVGRGNWYARIAMADEFVQREKARQLIQEYKIRKDE